jgi:hypothetical protein
MPGRAAMSGEACPGHPAWGRSALQAKRDHRDTALPAGPVMTIESNVLEEIHSVWTRRPSSIACHSRSGVAGMSTWRMR